ncbi:MAG: ABC transporter ATP-binding protein [Thermofilaceae archaeon]
MAKEEAIVVENVYFSYNGFEVLKGVSLTVKTGEVLALMGGNGAGKTTLIKQFNGLLKPQKGRVLVFGTDTREASVAQLARWVGLVFQNPDHQLFSESVEEEILFTLRNMGYPENRVKERCEYILRLFDLNKYGQRSPYMLSIGERKRLAIATVVSYDPDVLVLDEPTAGQDYFNKNKLARLINMMKMKGKGIVVVTHDMEFATQIADRVALMADGRIAKVGSARDVLTDRESLKVARLLPPQITCTAALLMQRGFTMSRIPILPGELYSELTKLLNSRGEGGNL